MTDVMTSMAAAFRKAGFVPVEERLAAIARETIEEHPRDYAAAYAAFRDAVRQDVELSWALFARFEEAAIRPVLAKAAEEIRRRRTPRVEAGEPGQSATDNQSACARSSAGRAAVTAAIARSLLDTFLVNGRPIGDVSAGEARTWGKARRREARFVELLTAGITDDQPLRRWVTPEEAEAAMARAREDGNE